MIGVLRACLSPRKPGFVVGDQTFRTESDIRDEVRAGRLSIPREGLPATRYQGSPSVPGPLIRGARLAASTVGTVLSGAFTLAGAVGGVAALAVLGVASITGEGGDGGAMGGLCMLFVGCAGGAVALAGTMFSAACAQDASKSLNQINHGVLHQQGSGQQAEITFEGGLKQRLADWCQRRYDQVCK